MTLAIRPDLRDQALEDAARNAALTAYCPYSNFRVGAAVRTNDGRLVCGCNVENASYGLTLCAERVALFATIAQGLKPEALAVACIDATRGAGADHSSLMPCGACRQVMAELLPPTGWVYVAGVGAIQQSMLLPGAFRLR